MIKKRKNTATAGNKSVDYKAEKQIVAIAEALKKNSDFWTQSKKDKEVSTVTPGFQKQETGHTDGGLSQNRWRIHGG